MHARVHTAAIHGIQAIPVEIEVDVGRGLPSVTLLGLPDAGVKEGRDRVRSALLNSGYEFPAHKVTVNLAPSHLRKEGPGFDLPLAIGLLAGSGQLTEPALAALRELALVGELALDGRLRPVRGALAMAIAARAAGRREILVPRESAEEAAAITGIAAIPVGSLVEAVGFLAGALEIAPAVAGAAGQAARAGSAADVDMADVAGQASAKRGLLVAAAGGHNVLLSGPPGTGKTMLARRLPTLLPALTEDEAIEVTQIQGVAGLLAPGAGLARTPPFRAPHHTSSAAALAGGGSPPRAGEVTLAHRGVLFLDELPEFGRHTLDTLRQPLEEGFVRIGRARGTVEFPADFLCVGAMNPCPCGYGADPRRPCECTPIAVRRYQGRLSGPLRDRFDLQIDVPPVRFAEARRAATGPTSAELRAEVEAARAIQRGRGRLNARLGARELREHVALDPGGEDLLRRAVEAQGFSARAIARTLRVARTCADLERAPRVAAEHVAEAIRHRCPERAGERAGRAEFAAGGGRG